MPHDDVQLAVFLLDAGFAAVGGMQEEAPVPVAVQPVGIVRVAGLAERMDGGGQGRDSRCRGLSSPT